MSGGAVRMNHKEAADLTEQCGDWINHTRDTEGDPTGRLGEFVEALRVIVTPPHYPNSRAVAGMTDEQLLRLANDWLGNGPRGPATKEPEFETDPEDAASLFAGRLLALAEENAKLRAVVEAETASAIAAFVDDRLNWDSSNDAALYAIVDDILAGKWKTTPLSDAEAGK